MTDKELIDKVMGRYISKGYYSGMAGCINRIIVRYTRWIERAECHKELEPREGYFICPRCDEEKPLSSRCSKGYCRACSSYDY